MISEHELQPAPAGGGEKYLSRILDRMRRLCSRREYCSREIYGKAVSALKKGLPQASDADLEKMASGLLSSLVSDRYVDDRRYAAAFARDKSSLSGWGRMKICRALSLKGIHEDIISDAVSTIDTSSASLRMEKVLDVKYRSLCKAGHRGDRSVQKSGTEAMEIKMKMLRYAAGRGYRYEEAAPVIERLISGS